MSGIASREALMRSIAAERRRLEANLAQIPAADFVLAGVCGDWSIKDILAHLAAWEQTFLRWYAARNEMTEPVEPEEVRTRAAIDRYNRMIFERYRDWSLDNVLKFSHQSCDAIKVVVREIPEEDIFTPGRYPWTGHWLLLDFVSANTDRHYLWAKTRIRRWQKQRAS